MIEQFVASQCFHPDQLEKLDKMMFFLKYFYLENFPFVINEQLWWNILKIYEYTAVIKLLPNSFDI